MRVISKGIKKLGCTTFRLNPFRGIDTLSNTTIGLKRLGNYTAKTHLNRQRNSYQISSSIYLCILDEIW